MESVEDRISKVYSDKAGFGSLKQTIADVKRQHPEIKRGEVEKWYRKNVEYNIVSRGSNSFVASNPLQIFQIDLFFMKSKVPGDQYGLTMGCIDIFTKYAVVVAIPDKKQETLLEGLKQIFKYMGKPKILMTDEEGGLQSKLVAVYLKKEEITYIINRGHAAFIERFIRTFRNMVSRRLQVRKDERWYNLIFEVMLTYNRKMVSSATGHTPAEAKKDENRAEVKQHMENRARHDKKYEEVMVGDRVRLYRKRKHLSEKEAVPVWQKTPYEVLRIDDDPNAGKLYYLSGQPDKPVIRSQILKISDRPAGAMGYAD
jgi:hypothetical protein